MVRQPVAQEILEVKKGHGRMMLYEMEDDTYILEFGISNKAHKEEVIGNYVSEKGEVEEYPFAIHVDDLEMIRSIAKHINDLADMMEAPNVEQREDKKNGDE